MINNTINITLEQYLLKLKANSAFKLSEEGIVTDMFFKDNLFTFGYKHFLNKNISDFYNLDEFENLSEISINFNSLKNIDIHRAKEFPSINKTKSIQKTNNITTTLPDSFLYIIKTPESGLFGIILINQIYTQSHNFRHHPLFILNDKSELIGGNKRFFKLLPNINSEQLLTKNVSDFLSIDPVKFVKGERDFFIKELSSNWKTAYHIDFNKEIKDTAKKILDFTQLKRIDNKWIWDTSANELKILPFTPLFNHTKKDVKFKIKFSIPESSTFAPAIILGGSKFDGATYPDHSTYILGFDETSASYVIKKEGQLINRKYFPVNAKKIPGHRKEITFEAFIKGNNLGIAINDEFVLGYRDPDIFLNEEGYIHFCYFNDVDIQLHEISIMEMTKSTKPKQLENGCYIKNGLENAFLFHPLFDIERIHKYNGNLFVFQLNDISYLSSNIKKLQKEKEKTIIERDNYKSIALGNQYNNQSPMIGQSKEITAIRENSLIVADSPVSVLIQGATGTGKEVLANFIHKNSLFKDGPFIKVDCARLPPNLLESELFGFEKGAFTGATNSKKGKFESADGGTLFLDEISNLNLDVQAKLLGFLQDFTIERIGSNKKITLNTRIIAATNIPLMDLVKKGEFRIDLYYRLNTIIFNLPALKERKEDIPLLSDYFVEYISKQLRKPPLTISSEAYKKLYSHNWPGNIRELMGVLQQAIIFCKGKIIKDKEINISISTSIESEIISNKKQTDIEEQLINQKDKVIPYNDSRALTKEHIEYLMQKNNGIAIRAAKEAGVSRATFFRKLKKFSIN